MRHLSIRTPIKDYGVDVRFVEVKLKRKRRSSIGVSEIEAPGHIGQYFGELGRPAGGGAGEGLST